MINSDDIDYTELKNDRASTAFGKAIPLDIATKSNEEIKDKRGSHFDPQLVDVFLNSIDDYKAIQMQYTK